MDSSKFDGDKQVEIRFFGSLKKLADEKGWPFPCFCKLEEECSARELAETMGIPADQIEGVFINGIGKPINAVQVRPGDRVGFIPYGIPGPYRVLLGFHQKYGNNSDDLTS